MKQIATTKQLSSQLSLSAIREMLTIAAVSLLIIGAIRLSVAGYQISGYSMEPTFTAGEHILVNKLAFLTQPPQRNDVVAAHASALDKVIVKRVIGLPGDEIVMKQGRLSLNGQPIEGFFFSPGALNLPISTQPSSTVGTPPASGQWNVPTDQYFLLGDNRSFSQDCTDIAFVVPTDEIIGKVTLRWWPLVEWKRMSDLSTGA